MLGNLQMNDHRITRLTNTPNGDDEATNKKYVDENISKSSIKPSHTPKNVFQYLMDDVNEWTTEYGVKVGVVSDLPESPHSWDKKVLNISPVKNGRNYRFRLGLQMFRMKTNESYSLVVELYNRDFNTWERQQTYVNGTGMWVRGSNTSKYQYHYGSSGILNYIKTLILHHLLHQYLFISRFIMMIKVAISILIQKNLKTRFIWLLMALKD